MANFLNWIESLPISTFVRESDSLFAFPGFLFVHTLGVSLVAGCGAVVCAAILGLWPRGAALSSLGRLYPAIWFGFVINAVTGVGLLMADATSRGQNPVFWLKLGCVALGVALLSSIRRTVLSLPMDKVVPEARSRARAIAWSCLACWLGAIVFGRLIAYVGPVGGL